MLLGRCLPLCDQRGTQSLLQDKTIRFNALLSMSERPERCTHVLGEADLLSELGGGL